MFSYPVGGQVFPNPNPLCRTSGSRFSRGCNRSGHLQNGIVHFTLPGLHCHTLQIRMLPPLALSHPCTRPVLARPLLGPRLALARHLPVLMSRHLHLRGVYYWEFGEGVDSARGVAAIVVCFQNSSCNRSCNAIARNGRRTIASFLLFRVQ